MVQGTTHDGVTLQSSGNYFRYNLTQSSQSINYMLALESRGLLEVLGGVPILGMNKITKMLCVVTLQLDRKLVER